MNLAPLSESLAFCVSEATLHIIHMNAGSHFSPFLSLSLCCSLANSPINEIYLFLLFPLSHSHNNNADDGLRAFSQYCVQLCSPRLILPHRAARSAIIIIIII